MSFLHFVENRINEAHSCSRTLRCAAASFADSLRKTGSVGVDGVTDEDVRNWIASMAIMGLKGSSCNRYIGEISALYREWVDSKIENNPFDSVKKMVTMGASEVGVKRANSNLRCVERLFKVGRESGDYETVSVFLYLLFDVGSGLLDVVNLEFNDSFVQLSQIYDIVEPMRESSRKKYVFGLDQGKKREGQIVREMLHRMHTVLSAYGFEFGNKFSRDSIVSVWIAAAVKAGLSVCDIRSIISSVPDEYSSLALVRPNELTSERRLMIMQKVADYINDGSSKWFVMRMRQGIVPDDIKDAITVSFGRIPENMMFYYPSHTVVSRDKKGKIIKDEKPYLPGVLFFKFRKDRVGELFSRIGNMAWCYKWTNSSDSPYCTISLQEMKAFQRHIGSFTSDIKMELVTRDTALAVDQTVRINGGGIMENHIGVIRSVRNNNGTRTYTLALSEKDYAIWTVEDIDEIYIEPVVV